MGKGYPYRPLGQAQVRSVAHVQPKQTLLQPILIITPTLPPSSSWLTLFVRELDSNTNSVVISSTEDKFKSTTSDRDRIS